MRKKIKLLFKRLSYYLLYKIYLFSKIEPKKIVISSYYGKGYGDSLKYIVEELGSENEYTIIWLVKKELLNQKLYFPKHIKLVEYDSFIAHKHLATAKVWIDNCRKPWYVQKRKQQFYIQLWHGSPALKQIEADALESLSKSYIIDAKTDSKKIDLFISNCKWFTEKIPRTFWYKGEIKEIGLPRNDLFFKENILISHIENYFKIRKEEKIILYAPTFRKNHSLGAYNIDFTRILTSLKNKTGDNWKILVRLHPNITQKAGNLKYGKEILDASMYPDLQELIMYSDILITDYSSVMFDFSITKKPVFLYCNDYKEYMNDRNFYFDLEKLPFSLTYTTVELEEAIISFNKEDYKNALDIFFGEIGLKEQGTASKEIVKLIKGL